MVPGAVDVLPLNVQFSALPLFVIVHVSVSVGPVTPKLAVASVGFVTDTLAPGGGVVAVSPGVQGFDWADAGIGAGGTVGLIVILLGGTRLMSQRRSALAV